MRHEEFAFTRAWLRGAVQHLNDVRQPEFLVGMKLNLPPDYLLIHRVWLGGIGVLCQLGAPCPPRHHRRAHAGDAVAPPAADRGLSHWMDAERPARVPSAVRPRHQPVVRPHHQDESSLPSMLRRWRRLHVSQVHTSRPFSIPGPR